MRHTLLKLLQLVTLMAVGQAALAQGGAWPNRPIRLIVSAAPGSLNDSIGRYHAEKLSKALGQQVIVDNKPGGANLIAMQAARSAPADGYTLLQGTSASFATNPHLMKSLPYDALKDFIPVALISRPGFTVAVHARLPVRSIAELAAYARSRPDGITVATDGPRNFTGLTAAYLARTMGVKMVPVAYKNIVQGAQDTASGTTDVVITGYGLLHGMITKGDLRPIAVTSPVRASLLPDLPTVAETYPGFDITGWIGLFVPAGTPPEIVARLNAEEDRILKDPEIRAWADRLYQSPEQQAGTPEALREFVRSQHAMWQRVVNQLGVQPE